ncbi:aminotransferase class IV [Corallococcus macrosporus]|uniref:branched-chain-amino-acid transaminase n=1 Tax=Myxococcus fulvus (strain ATCC BAA-855 / HW-1) TaxID=483219 RepID=F8C9U1_MYXFH|nr:aminotransferase class IV [Corallococcus macrosporus]AEI62091.1 class IV aminotransferase [Corallococcus macrosporus]
MFSTVAVNGEVRRWEDLPLRDFAQGFFFGAGFFTTFRIEAGRPWFLARHLARLRASLDAFPGAVRPPPPEHLTEDAVRESLQRCLRADAALGPAFQGVGKLSASDGRVLLTFRAHSPDLERLHHEGRALDSQEPGAYRRGDPTLNHKGLSYFRQYRVMERLPLLGNEAGEVCELPTANVFVQWDGALVTPPLSAPCLPGIIREVLLEAGHVGPLPVLERPVPFARLSQASACVFTNAAQVATGVPSLLGRALPDSLALAHDLRRLVEGIAARER